MQNHGPVQASVILSCPLGQLNYSVAGATSASGGRVVDAGAGVAGATFTSGADGSGDAGAVVTGA